MTSAGMKSAPVQYHDDVAREMTEDFIHTRALEMGAGTAKTLRNVTQCETVSGDK